MTLAEATERIQLKVGTDSGVGAKVKFIIDGEHIIHVDATVVPNVVSNNDQDADTTVRLTGSTFDKLMSGESNAMTAFMMGKIKIEGNMGIAMKINKIL
jgi:putative sterol carrier protein